MSDAKKQTSPLVWIASGCGILVLLYLLVSCIVPAVMYGVMALEGRSSSGIGTAGYPLHATTPIDLGPPGVGGPMLPMDPSEAAALADGGTAAPPSTVVPTPHSPAAS